MVKVVKRDGSTEEFDKDKLVVSVIKSGLTNEEAEELYVKVENWLGGVEEESIASTAIRDKVIEIMKEGNPIAAGSYESYLK